MAKQFHMTLDESNYEYLDNLRHEIMCENAVNIPMSRLMEMSLIELRKNNTKQNIKEKMVFYKRLGTVGMKGIISELEG